MNQRTKLEQKHPYQKDLGAGFVVKAIADLDEIVIVHMGTRYHLIKDNDVLYEFDMQPPKVDAWIDEAIFDQVEPFLNDYIGEGVTNQMKDLFLQRFIRNYAAKKHPEAAVNV